MNRQSSVDQRIRWRRSNYDNRRRVQRYRPRRKQGRHSESSPRKPLKVVVRRTPSPNPRRLRSLEADLSEQKQSRSCSNGSVFKVNSDAIFLCLLDIIICGKYVRAQVKTGDQRAYLGTEVANLVKQVTNTKPVRKAIKTESGICMKDVLMVPMGTRLAEMIEIECLIDDRIPKRSATIGLQTLRALGYQILVGGRQTYERVIIDVGETAQLTNEGVTSQEKEIPYLEDSVISGISEEEAHTIENM